MDNTRSTEQEKICANSGTSQFSPHSPLEAESDVDSSDSEQEGMEEEMKEKISYILLRSLSQLGRERVLMEETTPMAATMGMMEEPP